MSFEITIETFLISTNPSVQCTPSLIISHHHSSIHRLEYTCCSMRLIHEDIHATESNYVASHCFPSQFCSPFPLFAFFFAPITQTPTPSALSYLPFTGVFCWSPPSPSTTPSSIHWFRRPLQPFRHGLSQRAESDACWAWPVRCW